jgi:hypothetical protein
MRKQEILPLLCPAGSSGISPGEFPAALRIGALVQAALITLAHPEMDTTIVGTLHPEHLAKNVRIAEQGPLPAMSTPKQNVAWPRPQRRRKHTDASACHWRVRQRWAGRLAALAPRRV